MNGTEQQERRTAVARIEKRCEDVETVVMGIAQQAVKDREGVQGQIRELVDSVNKTLTDGHAQQKAYIDAADAEARGKIDAIGNDLLAFRDRSFRQRLRWLFLGR
jgi:uncharacterized protein YpuA (DUF1002 family)